MFYEPFLYFIFSLLGLSIILVFVQQLGKYEKISHIIYKTIKKYYDVIFKDENKLERVLSKFEIHANQMYFNEYKNRMKNFK